MVLYYNDYNDHIQPKAQTMYHMIKDINEEYANDPDNTNPDRPLISGVGMQGHYSTSVNIDNVRESLERFIDLGIEVGVTELDVGVSEVENVLTEEEEEEQDRKSTRLNSSHVAISYAVFCLKKQRYSTVILDTSI